MKLLKRKTGVAPAAIRYDDAPLRHRAAMLAALALLTTLTMELLNRGLSVPRLFGFIAASPLIFLFNVLIVFTSLVFSELFLRRIAMLGTVCLLWLVFGVVQYIVVRDRTAPFSSMDLLLIREALSLLSIYATLPQIIGIFLGLFGVFALVITLFTRARQRRRRSLAPALVAFVGCLLLCAMIKTVGMHAGLIPQRFDSLVNNYADYGFPLVFTYTFGQMGIARPNNYSNETVDEIMEDIGDARPAHRAAFDQDDNITHPNILFLQLESFIDVGTVKGCRVSRDPTPCFTRLKRECPCGTLYVPAVGGGTVNTEFEIITGLNLDYFGAGESPYSTVLQQTPCESMAYNMKQYGYTATALHNNGATFYNRNAVYPRLGFDCFVPVEYMPGVHTNAQGWAKDDILTPEILNMLERTGGRDLALCITVETHGKYQETYEPREGDIEVLALPEELPLAPFQNYVNLLPNTDAFLEALIGALTDFDEPTVVVAYGDHLPALNLTEDMLTTGSIFATEYVIWNNFGHRFDAPDLQAYRLNACVLGQLGFSGGAIARLHQSVAPDDRSEDYLSRLELLEYDILYGDHQAFDGDFPYEPTDMRLGGRDIEILDADLDYRRLLVTGRNFTGYSRVVLDGQTLDTLFVDPEHIIAAVQQNDSPIGSTSQASAFEEVAVAQVNSDGVELSRTEAFRHPQATANIKK